MYQTMEYEDQLNMKAEQVKNLLDKVIVMPVRWMRTAAGLYV